MYKDRIISTIAEKACKAIANRVIRHICTLTDGLLSGDNSNLVNIWDEICVQVQGEQSIFWDLYEDTVEGIVEFEVDKEDDAVLSAIWLQTDNGLNWDCDDANISHKEVNYDKYDIVSYILNCYIFLYASEWTNKRIRLYLSK